MRKTIENWRCVAPDAANHLLKTAHPGIQMGVFAFSGSGDPWAKRWQSLAYSHPTSRNDEPAAQMCYFETPNRVLDDRFNATPKSSGHHDRRGSDARIWHGSARGFFRTPLGRKLWFPKFAETLSLNIGNLQSVFANHI